MNERFIPQDQTNRDRIASDLTSTLFVEAGAGTGKTTALVARIAALVEAGQDISRVAAITFTEAAAAELRDRVRRTLQKAAEQDPAGPVSTRAGFFQKAAADLDNASIQTLHAFAGAILREQPLEAGLPPSFEVTEEIEAGLEFDEKWQEWLDRTLSSESVGPSLVKALRLGLRLDNLKGVARRFHENYDILPAGFPSETSSSSPAEAREESASAGGACSPESAAEPDFVRTFCVVVEEIAGLLSCSRKGAEDPLYVHCLNLVETAGRVRAAGIESDSALGLLTRAGKISFTRGKQGDWDNLADGSNACAFIKSALKSLHEQVSEGLERTRRDALLPLLESLRCFALDYARQRRRQGRLQFQDLLVLARDLLKNNLTARAYFQAKFSHILIDEFQDTDPIQAEIAFFLAGKPSDLPADWRRVDLEPGKLFVVGDPKQSIYRFRRADIVTVEEVKRLVCGETAAERFVPLVQNFRSLSPVIVWVNAAFRASMQPDEHGFQAEYLPLESRWKPEQFPGDGGVAYRPGVYYLGDALDALAPVVRRLEAEEISRAILSLCSGAWQVRHEASQPGREGPALRPLRFSDICILLPTRTGLETLERGLDSAAIPYRVESQSLLLGTSDIRELLACLRAVDSPADRVALVAALRSSAFALSDVELLQFVENGGRLDYTSPGSADGPVGEALQFLRECHLQRVWHSPAEIIEDFIRRRHMEEVCFGRARPRERLHRLRFVVEKARAYSEVKGSSLRGFLDWIETLAAENARLIEVPVPETDEDAVRIMTVHAAKGREFPAVFLMGLGSNSRYQGESVLFDRRSGAVEVSLGSSSGPRFFTAGFDEMDHREAEAETAERVRLLYVAATRARDYLVVSLYRTQQRSDQSPAAQFVATFQSIPELWQPLEIAPFAWTSSGTASRGSDSPQPEDTPAARQQWQAARERLLQQASRPRELAATAIARINKEAVEDEYPHRTGRGGTKLGRAVHSVLQTLDLATGAALEQIAAAQAAAEGIPERAGDVVKLVRQALDSPVVRRAAASRSCYREVFVSSPLSGVSVDGFIDLLFEEADGYVIVDYKTDDLEAEPSPALQSQYALQAGVYALTARRVTGRPIKEVVLLFLRGPRELSFTALDDLILTAEQSVAGALHPPSP